MNKWQALASVGLMVVMPQVFAQAWEFELTPYAWLAGSKGTSAAIPGAPAAEVDVSSRQALEHLEAAIAARFIARKGAHGLYTDLFYSDVGAEKALLQATGLTGKLNNKVTLLSLAYQYRVFDGDRANVDIMLGARYWEVDTRIKFRGGVVVDGVNVAHEESWVDPFLAIKGKAFLGASRVFVNGGLGISGGGESDDFYEAQVDLGYQWTEGFATTVGYRQFEVDYSNGGFVYDMQQMGWQLGFSWVF